MREKQICIIDGYNVIHKIGNLRKALGTGSLLSAREGLLRYCSEWWRSRRDVHCFYVVFDGDSSVLPQGFSSTSEVVIIFTKTRQTADDKIIQLLDRYNDDYKYIVVSADQYVVRNAQKRHASVMSPVEFYSVLSEKIRRKQGSGAGAGGDKNLLSPEEQNDITNYLKKLWVDKKK